MLKDLVTAAILLLVAIGYYSAALDINQSALADELGAAGLPILYAILLGALALVLVAKALVGWRFRRVAGTHAVHAFNDLQGEGRRFLHAAGMLSIGLLYLLLVRFAGYVITLMTVIALVALYQGERASWRLGATTLFGAVAFWILFDLILGIETPAGFWPRLWGG
jgi:putative tricarboxylic transport membrane protein